MKDPLLQETTQISEKPGRINRRQIERVPTQFSLVYSGMHEGQMFIGNGMVTNFSDTGIGIRGNRLVQLGMELALFIDLPSIKEPVCIAQSRVSWVNGHRFGVEMVTPKLEVQNALRFCVWNRLFRPLKKKR
ncbi:PilZ domain-containing protein [Petrachloros mirabilis]